MRRSSLFSYAAGASALIALSTLPAYADPGKADRAHSAIAEARAKIEAGDKVGAGTGAPELQGRARGSLASAQALLDRGKKDESIVEAKRASEFADMAIVSADRHKAMAATGAQVRAENEVDASHRATDDANMRADSAQKAAMTATMDANMRVDAAQQAAASATAQADALRNAPPVTTVSTVEKVTVHSPARPATRTRHRVIHRAVHKHAPVVGKTTVTTTTTSTTKRP